jgi:hypothetical protein
MLMVLVVAGQHHTDIRWKQAVPGRLVVVQPVEVGERVGQVAGKVNVLAIADAD